MSYPKYSLFILFFFLLNLAPFSPPIIAADRSHKPMPWVPLLMLNDTLTITISGKATIPNYTPAGQLLILVDGLDGHIYGTGMSDTSGDYLVRASIPKGISTVLVIAVDPNNPDEFVKGYIELDETISTKELSATSSHGKQLPKVNEAIFAEQYGRDLHIQSMAESFVREATGKKPRDVFAEDWQNTASLYLDIFRKMENGTYTPKQCSVQSDITIDSLYTDLVKKHRSPLVRNWIDTFVRQEGDYISRVRKAQQAVTNRVTSSNREWSWGDFSLGIGTYAANSIGVRRTRGRLEHLGLPSNDPNSVYSQISVSDLEAAAALIINIGGSESYGNCNEKGLVGAYIASRFNEFKQIAFIAMHSNLYPPIEIKVPIQDPEDILIIDQEEMVTLHTIYRPHAFAIACTEPKETYDLQTFYDAKTQSGYQLPPPYNGIYNADCYLIDPWEGVVRPLTSEAVSDLQWTGVENLMSLNLTQTGKSNTFTKHDDLTTYLTNGSTESICKSCPVNSTCEPCQSNVEVASAVCTRFTPPVASGKQYYYLFKRSGTGYRKMWSGWSTMQTGHDFFYHFMSPAEAESVTANYANLRQFNTVPCERGPAICPCPPYPDIWASGQIELVGIFETAAELDPYRCDNPHWGGYRLICNMWNENSEPYPGFWPAIEGICGN